MWGRGERDGCQINTEHFFLNDIWVLISRRILTLLHWVKQAHSVNRHSCLWLVNTHGVSVSSFIVNVHCAKNLWIMTWRPSRYDLWLMTWGLSVLHKEHYEHDWSRKGRQKIGKGRSQECGNFPAWKGTVLGMFLISKNASVKKTWKVEGKKS